MIPAVMLLVRIGLASINPRYQLTNPLLALTLAAAIPIINYFCPDIRTYKKSLYIRE